MDTFSSSVSTLNVSTIHSTTSSRELHHFNPQSPRKTHKLPPQPQPPSLLHSLHSTTTKPSSFISTKTPSFLQKPPPLSSTPSFSNPIRLSSPPSPNLHRNPAAGYAAALLDISQCYSSVHLVEQDIRRFLKLLHNRQVEAVLANPLVGLEEKGQVVKLVAEKGGFSKHLVGLVKMLVGKKKVGIVREVLEEFQRIYSDLCGAVKVKKKSQFGISMVAAETIIIFYCLNLSLC
ncbi:hypothetical protein ACFX1Z_000890 [Malus domestica]